MILTLVSDVTWDYIRHISIEIAGWPSDQGFNSKVCIYCIDYYASTLEDESTTDCTKIMFSKDLLENLRGVKAGRQSKQLLELYSFQCAYGTIKDDLTVEELSRGDVCESYTFNGNYQVNLHNIRNTTSTEDEYTNFR